MGDATQQATFGGVPIFGPGAPFSFATREPPATGQQPLPATGFSEFSFKDEPVSGETPVSFPATRATFASFLTPTQPATTGRPLSEFVPPTGLPTQVIQAGVAAEDIGGQEAAIAAQLVEIDGQIARLESGVAYVNSFFGVAENALNLSQSDRERLNREVQLNEAALEQVRRELTDLNESYQDARNQLSAAQEQLLQAQRATATGGEETQQLGLQIQNLQEQVRVAQAQVAQLDGLIATRGERISSLEEEIRRQALEFAGFLATQNRRLSDQIARLNAINVLPSPLPEVSRSILTLAQGSPTTDTLTPIAPAYYAQQFANLFASTDDVATATGQALLFLVNQTRVFEQALSASAPLTTKASFNAAATETLNQEPPTIADPALYTALANRNLQRIPSVAAEGVTPAVSQNVANYMAILIARETAAWSAFAAAFAQNVRPVLSTLSLADARRLLGYLNATRSQPVILRNPVLYERFNVITSAVPTRQDYEALFAGTLNAESSTTARNVAFQRVVGSILSFAERQTAGPDEQTTGLNGAILDSVPLTSSDRLARTGSDPLTNALLAYYSASAPEVSGNPWADGVAENLGDLISNEAALWQSVDVAFNAALRATPDEALTVEFSDEISALLDNTLDTLQALANRLPVRVEHPLAEYFSQTVIVPWNNRLQQLTDKPKATAQGS